MEKFMSVVLPKYALSKIFEYSFEPVFNGDKKFPICKYITKTFAKNISYMENKHPLRCGAEETTGLLLRIVKLRACKLRGEIDENEEDELDRLKSDTVILHDIISTVAKTNNIGALKYLYETGELHENIYNFSKMLDMMSKVSSDGSLEMMQYLIRILHISHNTPKYLYNVVYSTKYGQKWSPKNNRIFCQPVAHQS